MNLFAIMTLILMYLIFGIFTWQFWLLAMIGAEKDVDKIQQLARIPLIVFLFFWPISIFILLIVFIIKRIE